MMEGGITVHLHISGNTTHNVLFASVWYFLIVISILTHPNIYTQNLWKTRNYQRNCASISSFPSIDFVLARPRILDIQNMS